MNKFLYVILFLVVMAAALKKKNVDTTEKDMITALSAVLCNVKNGTNIIK